MLPDKPTDRSVTRNGITYTQNTANIGKRPKSAISAAGLPVHVTAATHTAAGLVDALAGLLGVAQPLP